MSKFNDLTGKVFGRLTVLERGDIKSGKTYWRCRCACGNELSIRGTSLSLGLSESCGCLKNEVCGARTRTHGHTANGRSGTYISWMAMHARCKNPKHKQYENYGGRGIKVCERWDTFANFLADMGERPDDKTLDRKDANGNYEPDNCRWATNSQQQKNKRKK